MPYPNACPPTANRPRKLARTGRRAAAGLGLFLLAGAAMGGQSLAEEAPGQAIIAWVESIDASPDWAAEIRGLSVDKTNDTATIENLLVSTPTGAVVLEVHGATVSGYAENSAGGFTASSLRIANGTIRTPGTEVALTNIAFDDIGVPSLAAISYDSAKPFTSLIAAYSALAKSRMAGGQIAEIAITETFEGQKSRISYQNIVMGHLAEGKIDGIRAGPLKVQSPAADPLTELQIAQVDARAIDLDAFLHVYDPLRYVAGTGDGVWRRAIDQASYSDVAMTLPGVRLTIDAVTTENLLVRQPKESFAPLIDALMSERNLPPAASDALASRYLGRLLSAFGAGRFAIENVNVAATGIDQLTLDRFEMSNLSADEFGEIAVEGFVGAIAGQGAITIRRLAVGDMVIPAFETFKTAVDRAQRDADVDISSLAPQIGFVEASDISLQAIDFPGAAIGQMRADFGKHLGNLPTEIAVRMDDLDIAAASLPLAGAKSMIAALGYERIRVDAGFSLNWHESDERISLDDFQLDIEDFGKTTANVILTGLTREAIERSDGGSDLLADLFFNRARVTFEDKSVVERSLSMRADLLNIPLDRLKQQLAGALPLMLAFVGDPEKVKAIVPVLQNFIKTPGTLTIEATPETPVPVEAIEAAIRSRPQSLPGLLSINISGTPGNAVPDKSGALEEPPAMRTTIEPESRPGTTGSTRSIPAKRP